LKELEQFLQIEHCEFPDDALYDIENNIWVKLDEGKLAVVGITSVHAALAGKIAEVRFKPTGSILQKGQSIATIESVRYFGAVRTPFSGSVTERNVKLESNPKLANDYPYSDGWFVKLQPTQLAEDIKRLVNPRAAEESIRSSIAQLRVRCFKAFPDYEMWEIGVECAAVLVRLDELINQGKLNDVVHVVSDDPTADIEMVRWSDQTGQEVLESRREGRLMHFIVRKVR
jgi:glycine cleavage system H lipoate-binding protein/TusA-related sulfurtransferase